MATVVLQVVGAAIGGVVGGPAGAVLGRALGAAAGYSVDQKLFSKDQIIRGGRLENSRFVGSTDGAAIPRSYGRVRLGGQIIWATRFREVRKKSSSGGKGGAGGKTETVTYKYYGNFAIGICEGEVSHIGRIWADGKEIDQTLYTIRKYPGSENQLPDPLIEAKQGNGKTPAFRGTAYAVFDNFPLADFGNRIPQLSFEIIRRVGKLETGIRSVTIIPGSSEFGYEADPVRTTHRGKTTDDNRHNLVAATDWEASIDELQALCPNLQRVSLVVAWFGTDLRAGECRIEPRAVHQGQSGGVWKVSGRNRSQVNTVTSHLGTPAYGGTPSDRAVLSAIADLKSRGLEVAIYPFVMMDVEENNTLPDPYGGNVQPAYPWRGRITVSPASDQPATADKTAAARSQTEAFLGNAAPGEFSSVHNTIRFDGEEQWSYRRMVLHYAHLCAMAGGVDAFLIGSEMRGLTSVRDDVDAFPFVEGLVSIADDCRQILGASTTITYAADWSEYFGYHPANATDDVFFNLDPLWASANIDAIGIDNYMPLANWSADGDPANPDEYSAHDLGYLQSNILGGEGYDWYYASEDDRFNQIRTPITDGQGEPWIWSYKNLPEWWSNLHYERVGGIRSTSPTGWIPESKPVWFTELGCPAVDRGANRPNVFLDPKSSENALPWFSRGGRDDLIQLRFNQAHLSFWSEDNTQKETANPVSGQFGQRMVSPENISLWAWDARPFPAFPQNREAWSDGLNWYRGHWLNGRLGGCPLDDLITTIFADFGFREPVCDVDGFIDGYVISGDSTPRQGLESLLELHRIVVSEEGDTIAFKSKNHCEVVPVPVADMLQENSETRIAFAKQSEIDQPREVIVSHADLDVAFDSVASSSKRLETASDRQQKLELPAVLGRETAERLATARLRDYWSARQTAEFKLPWKYLHAGQGDIIRLENQELYQITTTVDGNGREISARGFRRFDEGLPWKVPDTAIRAPETGRGAPEALVMNLPLGQDTMDPEPRLYVAAKAIPWRNEYAILRSPIETGFERVGSVVEPALIFELLNDVGPGPVGRWDYANVLEVSTIDPDDQFESVEPGLVLAGGNPLAIATAGGGWEVLQFKKAEIIGPNTWRLSELLRGQLGSNPESGEGISTGSRGVLLDSAIVPVTHKPDEVGLSQNWKIGPAGLDISSEAFLDREQACSWASNRPLSPCHLAMERLSGSHRFHWIRRSRVNSDSWDGAEVPLDYLDERYSIKIVDANGQKVRENTVNAAEFDYPDMDRASDLGAANAAYEIEVAQLSNNGLPGPTAGIFITP